jgi:hypothetical protein
MGNQRPMFVTDVIVLMCAMTVFISHLCSRKSWVMRKNVFY